MGCGTKSHPNFDPLSRTAVANKEQEQEIRALIEQLVFADCKASKVPIFNPDMVKNGETYRARSEACKDAFQKLSEFKGLAFPFLVEHLKDDRQSIPFRNHFRGQSVGDACHWNIYFQLQDRPPDYSSYGDSRQGRDGQYHSQPYWVESPFADAGGLAKWLDANKELSYTEKQIKCLNWLLEKEKAIGACDAESYFVNILPLEIRILEHKLEMGQNVRQELDRLRRIKKEKLVYEIPSELLPAK